MNINELKSIWRKLKRDKVITGINLLGLTIGIAAVMTLSAFGITELKRGKEVPDAQNIYRTEIDTEYGHVSLSPDPFGNFLKEKTPDIIASVNIHPSIIPGNNNLNTLETKNTKIKAKNILFADSSYAKVFEHKTLHGDIANALNKPNGIVLTKSESEKIFGNTNPIGKIVKLNGEYNLEVGAVIEDVPHNAINYFQSIVNIDIALPKDNDKWNNFRVFTYFRIAPDANLEQIENIAEQALNEHCREITGIDFTNNITLVPYSELYYYKPSIIEHLKHGSYQTTIIFISIAVLILIIAVINFINLSWAQNMRKIKEIGIRQISGSSRSKIFMMFICESMFLTFVSFLLALILFEISSNIFTNHNLSNISSVIYSPLFISLAFTGLIVISIITGIYPALRTLKINTLQSLKYDCSLSKIKGWTGYALTSFQFIIAIVLIASIITVNKQLHFIDKKNIGFNKDNLVYFLLDNNKGDLIFNELSQYHEIKSFCLSDGLPGNSLARSSGNLYYEGKNKQVKYTRIHSDYRYISTMGMTISQGRNFMPGENNLAIINESAAKSFGIESVKNQPKIEGYTIVGIVKDFQIESLHQQTEPTVVTLSPYTKYGIVRVALNNKMTFKEATNHIKTAWNKAGIEMPLEIHFLNKTMETVYQKDIVFRKVLNTLVFLALFIACIGLFGISLFLINNRIKEIGIRKVNGAKISEVLVMLNKDFVKWVAIAFIIATPLAWFAMHKWLENFAYKTDLSWWIFALSGVLALLIALLTVSWQSWRAATRNPVEALRYE